MITLKELTAANQRLEERNRLTATKETMSMEEFRKLRDSQEQATESIQNVEKSLTDKTGDGLNSNVVKMAQEIKKTAEKTGEAIPVGTPTIRPADLQPEGEPVRGRYYGGFKGGVEDILKNFKKLGSLEGWVDVEGMGGIMGNVLKKRRAKKEWIQDEMRISPGTSRREAAARFEQVNKARGQEEKRVAEVERLRTSGRSDEEIARLGLMQPVTVPPRMAAPLAAVQTAKANLMGTEEAQVEQNQVVAEQTDSLKNIEENTAAIPALAEAIRGVKSGTAQASAGQDSNKPKPPFIPVPTGGFGTAIKNVARTGIGLGRAALSFVGGGSAIATGGAVIGGALLAGWAGKKLREHVEEKEAQNQEAYKKEVSEKGIDVETLKKLPDDGKAWKPSDVSEADRLRNLADVKIQQQLPFTEEEASLTKQKLGVVVPKELIGAKNAEAVASQPTSNPATPAAVTNTAAAKASQPTGSTALQQAETAIGGVQKATPIVAAASMTGAGINQQVGLTQPGVERAVPQTAAPTAAESVYGQSAANKAAEQTTQQVAAPTIVNAPSTNVQQTTNNVVRNPARNTESSLQWYTRSRFA